MEMLPGRAAAFALGPYAAELGWEGLFVENVLWLCVASGRTFFMAAAVDQVVWIGDMDVAVACLARDRRKAFVGMADVSMEMASVFMDKADDVDAAVILSTRRLSVSRRVVGKSRHCQPRCCTKKI